MPSGSHQYPEQKKRGRKQKPNRDHVPGRSWAPAVRRRAGQDARAANHMSAGEEEITRINIIAAAGREAPPRHVTGDAGAVAPPRGSASSLTAPPPPPRGRSLTLRRSAGRESFDLHFFFPFQIVTASSHSSRTAYAHRRLGER
jgi:hypothetical protein